MNRIISKVITMGLVFSSMLFISGCENVKFDSEYRKEMMAQVIDSLSNRDPKKVRNLFAPNAIKEIPNIDESITELFNYYQGAYVSRTWEAAVSKASSDRGVVRNEFDLSFDITTTEDVYRFALNNYRVRDSGDKKNVGIWQFFIIRFDDDPNPEYYYWGDWSEEPGLIIGKYHVMEEPTEEEGTYE